MMGSEKRVTELTVRGIRGVSIQTLHATFNPAIISLRASAKRLYDIGALSGSLPLEESQRPILVGIHPETTPLMLWHANEQWLSAGDGKVLAISFPSRSIRMSLENDDLYGEACQ